MKHNPPNEPDYTCPLINTVLAWIDDFDLARKELSKLTVLEIEEVLDHYQANVSEIQSTLEKIRAANDALRRRSQYFEEEYNRVDSDLDDRNLEVSNLRENIKELESLLEDKS